MKNIQINIAKSSLLILLVLTGCSNPQILEEAEGETLVLSGNVRESISESNSERPSDESKIDAENISGETEIDTEIDTESSNQPVCYVHISGAVKYPGVYQMEPQSRLYEAVMKAGGFEESASEDYCNLAQTIVDGMRYYIPTKDEVKEILVSDNGLYLAREMTASAEETAGPQKENPQENQMENKEVSEAGYKLSQDGCYDSEGRLDINQAGIEELTGLTGIGTTRAEAIIAYRTENGSFQRIEDLMKVSGIKEGTYNQLKDKIVVR